MQLLASRNLSLVCDSVPAGHYFEAMLSGKKVQRTWHTEKFQNIINRIPEGAAVLDIGCGPGSFLWLLGKLRPDVLAVGVDVSQKQIDYATREILPFYPNQPLSFRKIDEIGSELLKWEERFDVLVCSEVIEHISPEKAHQLLSSAKKLLKPNGKLILTTPNYRSFWPLIEMVWNRINPIDYSTHHINRYTPSALIKFAESVGYKITDRETIFLISPFLSIFSDRLYHWAKTIESILFPGFGSLLLIEAKLNKESSKLSPGNIVLNFETTPLYAQYE